MMRPMPETVVITGAAGGIGTILRRRLPGPDRQLRLVDIAPFTDDAPTWIAPLSDTAVLDEVLKGADAVIHLAGQARESDIRDVLENNAYGTYCLLEAVRRAGVPRVILASSNHATGFHTRAREPLPADIEVRPDTLYGWSKAAIEAMGRLYADRYGLSVICLRIGICVPEPVTLRQLGLWLSPGDCGRLFDACLTAAAPGYRTVWGVSANTRGFLSLETGQALGYQPRDDSEAYAHRLIASLGEPDYDHDPVVRRIGGEWCDVPLGEPY
jgi:nucleoside-diphosphate-sugar epimerase